MSKRTDKIAAKAKLAADKAEKEAKALADKLAVAEAADREAARSSPADKAMERAFARGTLPMDDRRAPGFQTIPDGGVEGGPRAAALSHELAPDRPPGSVDTPVHPTEPVEPSSVPLATVAPVADVSEQRVVAAQSFRDALTFEGTPIPAPVAVAPEMAKTPDALVPLDEVAPSTVEAAIAFQRIPNDRIHHVHERADGTKVDALGHIFESAPKPK